MQGGGVQNLELPAGFRFHPTDEELVVHYLCPKCAHQQINVPIIAEIDLYKFDPWQLPGMALYGEKEWYFFSPRDRKYPNGSRPNRAAGSGYWKATGADKPVGKPKTKGIKKALVFYTGKAPRGIKTNWIMHEYRLANVDRSPGNKNNSRLDDWVLCRIYNKKGVIEKHHIPNQESSQVMENDEEQKPKIAKFVQNEIAYSTMKPEATTNEHLRYDDTSESTPRFHSDSSWSGQVLSPEFTCNKEVQSAPKWTAELDRAVECQLNYMNGFQDDSFASQMQYDNQFFQLQDMLMYMQKPF